MRPNASESGADSEPESGAGSERGVTFGQFRATSASNEGDRIVNLAPVGNLGELLLLLAVRVKILIAGGMCAARAGPRGRHSLCVDSSAPSCVRALLSQRVRGGESHRGLD